MVVSADRQIVAAGGCDKALITATVTVAGKPQAGKKVDFETTSGSFSPTEELTYTSATTDDQGMATVELYATRSVGQATVTAQFSDDTYDTQGSITIRFGPPSGRFAPVSDAISLHCEYQNLGALREGRPEIVVPCTLSAQTAEGCPLAMGAFLDGESLILKAEAGTLEAVPDPWSDTVVLRYRTTGGNPDPVDVDPVSGEPSRAGSLGETKNPRDGVVTLLAVVRGREAFDDLNGNGVYDPGETYDEIGEPFLDVDDDGVYTAGTDPFFADSDGDGKYSGPNGTYDATTYIGAWFKVVWTGDVLEHPDAARIELNGSENISNGGSTSLDVYLLDANLNPIAAFAENGDNIYYQVSGSVAVNPASYSESLDNKIAVRFDADGLYLEYLPDAAVYHVTLSDSDSTYEADPPEDWSLEVVVYSTAGLDQDGSYLTQETYAFDQVVNGTSR